MKQDNRKTDVPLIRLIGVLLLLSVFLLGAGPVHHVVHIFHAEHEHEHEHGKEHDQDNCPECQMLNSLQVIYPQDADVQPLAWENLCGESACPDRRPFSNPATLFPSIRSPPLPYLLFARS